MRTMSYRIELEKDNGYIIANSGDNFGGMPTAASFSNPPLRITGVDIHCGDPKKKLEDYLEVCDPFDEADKGFRRCYRKALYKETNGWRLIAITISRYNVHFWFGKQEGFGCEFLSLASEDIYFCIDLEAPRRDGGTERYSVTGGGMTSSSGQYSLCVTEHDFCGGTRKIFLNRGVEYDKDHPDPEWEYAYVKEYR